VEGSKEVEKGGVSKAEYVKICEPSSLSFSLCSHVDASTEVCSEYFGIDLRL
jgi:hypothetical protein